MSSAVINVSDFGTLISDKDVGNQILDRINNELSKNDFVVIDFENVITMATYSAKQIFGHLFVKLMPPDFFNKIKFKNLTEDLEVAIQIGIESALNDNNMSPQ